MMHATGYLPEKLAAWEKVALAAADAAGKQRQTPDIVLGGGDEKPSLESLMQMTLARQLKVAP